MRLSLFLLLVCLSGVLLANTPPVSDLEPSEWSWSSDQSQASQEMSSQEEVSSHGGVPTHGEVPPEAHYSGLPTKLENTFSPIMGQLEKMTEASNQLLGLKDRILQEQLASSRRRLYHYLDTVHTLLQDGWPGLQLDEDEKKVILTEVDKILQAFVKANYKQTKRKGPAIESSSKQKKQNP